MWFKTRVGLASIADPVEILVAKIGKPIPYWYIYARSKTSQEATGVSLFGRWRFSNPVTYLAMFAESDSASKDLAKCMSLIETSIRAKADLCDLSEAGDAAVWPANWNHIQWERQA